MPRLIAIFLLAFASCSSATNTCDFTDISFHKDFDGARFNGCAIQDDGSYVISLKPENVPINPSPWYAMRIDSRLQQSVNIILEVENGKPRYQPKISSNKRDWQSVVAKVGDNRMSFPLVLQKGNTWLAGQPLFDSVDYWQWMSSHGDQLEMEVLGHSKEQRPIGSLLHRSKGNEWIIMIGRQHPPELTGAFGMRFFVDNFLSEVDKNEAFLERFNLLIVPLVNPDGVFSGNWRHNQAGVDLNRDWFARSQPETQAVHNKIKEITQKGGRVVFALDFHSTHKDVFYTMPQDYGLANPSFASDWLSELRKQVYPLPVIETPGQSKQGIFKQYIADTYSVHAVTYEVGDDSNMDDIKIMAETSSSLLIEKLLKSSPITKQEKQ
jgi:hypothetical protein